MNQSTPIYDLLRSLDLRVADSQGLALAELVTVKKDFHPFPTIDDGWTSLPADLKAELVSDGEAAADYTWPALLAVRYLDFKRNGNRTRYAATYNERRYKLASLVFAECCRDDGTHIDQIANGIWQICEESSWCVPAHIHAQVAGIELPDVSEPVIDLFAAETAALLSWILYLIRPRLEAVSPLIVPRIESEVRSRILESFAARDDFFWMGFSGNRVNNWNPWINSNVLACILLIEEDDARRASLVEKTIRSVDYFVGPYPKDGGCDEGPSYWGRAGASLFDYLELLAHATSGALDACKLPIVREIGKFIYRVHIDSDQFVNFADAPAVVSPPGELVERFGRRIDDPVLEGFGRWLVDRRAGRSPDTGKYASPGRSLPAIFWNTPDKSTTKTSAEPPLPRDVWLDEIQVMVARDKEASTSGFYVAIKGGHNDESHNHNDIGNFVVYTDGKPVIVDAGVETYRRETFSDKRYTIWTMQSAYHSLLPTIDGVMQVPGGAFRATDVEYECTEALARLSLDIARAYPLSAGLDSWKRTFVLNRGDGVEVSDRCRFTKLPSRLEMAILTACSADASKPGEIALSARTFGPGRTSGDGILSYDHKRFDVTVESIRIDDERMMNNWGDTLFRLVFSLGDPKSDDQFSFSLRSS